MTELNDHELLAEFARSGSEVAFATLTARHVNLVYSAALRFCGDAQHCEEITQAVFIILARKAAGLRPDIILPGWLCETTRLTALSFLRGERRRQFREQEAYMQSTLQEANETAAWHQLAPLLDEALARLGKKERDAVVLRFFKDQNLREVAAALNINEPAAQRRVHRAVEKLRQFFMKRGLAFSSGTITGAISANSVQAAPVALAKTVTVLAVAKGAAAGTATLTLVKGALKIMTWTQIKTAVVVGVGVLVVCGSTWIIPQWIKELHEARNSFQVEGTLDYTVHGKPGAHKNFIAYVKSDKWLIRFPVQTNGIDYEENAFDGENTFSYMQLQRETIPSNSQNSSTGIVGLNDIPDLGGSTDQTTPIWLAYCSAHYFAGITGNKMKSFLYLNRPGPELGQGPYMEVEWKHSDKPPFVPTYIYHPKINERYRVLQFTNFNGLMLPSEFILECFDRNLGMTSQPFISMHGVLTGISRPSIIIKKFRPMTDGRTYTEDRRFPGKQPATYVNTSKDWLSTNSTQWQTLAKMYDPTAGAIVWPRNDPKISGVVWPH